ncbi:amino acid racemase [Halieaceae bacterium IMCC14734]|uniref:Amino acid racemase n=2 Tax=Candidatus Litorirhabdus singularis TaxID=2518993 RepID=A0ABT3TBA5_9GAMM|nr:amino acid racemase [Candidatus Litorirhabdus singularis]
MGPGTDLTAGVLGGLGPEATVDFMAKVIAATDASCDQDHIRLLIDHNPKVPNRNQALAGETPSVGPELAAMAQRLEQAGADFLVMVCNTAHAYSDDIRAAISIPFVSIIDVVMDELSTHSASRVGIMAAQGCLQAQLYQQALIQANCEPVVWSDAELATFMELVYRIKAGERDADISSAIEKLAASLAFSGADLLISGCTEIPLFMGADNSPLPLLSSTDLLVARTIALARQQLPLTS